MKNYFKRISPNTLLCLIFGVWWIINLLQAAFTELADDEAYYYLFSQSLELGYFDHPPMTALLVRMGSLLGGEFGIRLFFTILQPVYLYILYRVIKPDNEPTTHRDVVLFAVICAAMPIMQLYGFIAVPDAPLMFFSALFLLFYKRFTERNTTIDAILMGVAIAALAYSKYHGALVVLFTLLSNVRIFRNPRLYLAGAVAVILILPHLWWQYEHDWASFSYHLSGRNKMFRANYVSEYLLNLVAIFNPLFFPLYIKAWIKTKAQNPTQRAMMTMIPAFILFFGFSSLRGYVQPQWIIPITFGFIMILWLYARKSERLRKYVMWTGLITISLVLLLRIEMVFNPIGLRYQIFNNHESYSQIKEVAGERPVIFSGRYDIPAKYMFYTGAKNVATLPSINYRISQWALWDKDTELTGETVLMEGGREPDSTITLANGRTFAYTLVENFHPVRRINIDVTSAIPSSIHRAEVVNFSLSITNPYEYAVELSPDSIAVVFAICRKKPDAFIEVAIPQIDTTLQPGATINYDVPVVIPQEVKNGKNTIGFTIKSPVMGYWFNSKTEKLEVI